jgi:steroid 5-alpha reductase family enzyme
VIWLVIGARIGQAWALAAAGQLVLWLVQQRTRNAGIVDVGWAFAFAAVIALFAATASAPMSGWLPIAIVACAWSLRLGGYLVSRGAARAPEDGRYADLRARWAPHAAMRFFIFFQAQAALVGVLSLALVLPFCARPHAGTVSLVLRIAGVCVSACGILGEATADAQLARWRRDPAHRGAVCDVGLWGWSRHPNYFFEWCVWLGYECRRRAGR